MKRKCPNIDRKTGEDEPPTHLVGTPGSANSIIISGPEIDPARSLCRWTNDREQPLRSNVYNRLSFKACFSYGAPGASANLAIAAASPAPKINK